MERNCYKSGTELLSKWHRIVIQVARFCYPSGTGLLSKWHRIVIQVAQNTLVTY